MPVEWKRKSWTPGSGGWPTFDEDGKIVKPDDESAYDAQSRHERAAVEDDDDAEA